MKINQLILIILILVTVFCCKTHAQGRGDTSPENALPRPIISPSPEAGALGKYGNVPVGLFKGMANIDIPFYTLTKGDISVPVSINYSSSGIKVNEISTNVGLEWTLMAGGVIAVSSVDKSDFNPAYSRNVSIDPKNFNPNSGSSSSPDYIFAKSYVSGRSAADLEPDILTYNFCGRSGKFFFDTDLQVGHTIPASSVKIYRGASGFTITDERGTRYLFTLTESSFVTDSCTIGTTPRETASRNDSFYLTQIIDSKGNVVNLTYESTDYYYSEGVEEAQYFSQLTGECALLTDHNSSCIKVKTVNGKRIKTISAADNSVSISFNYSTVARQDLNSLAGTANVPSSLDQVVVSTGAKVIKMIALTHDYFKAGGYDTAPNSMQKALLCRLKLTSVTESGKQPYILGYYEANNFPARINSGADYWGYYNGGSGNTNIPVVPNVGNPGRNLESDFESTKTGLLTKIRYPTGGSTTLEYEQNDNWVWSNVAEMVQHNVDCGTLPHTTDTCFFHLDYDVYSPTIIYNLDAGGHDPGFASIDGPNGIHLGYSGHGSQTLNQPGALNVFPAGNYTIIVENTLGLRRNNIGILWLHYESTMHLDHNIMGGLRIAKTIDSTVVGLPVKKFYKYTLSDTSQATSLFYNAITPQNYDYPYKAYHLGTDGGVVECDYHVLHSAPIPLIGQGDRNDYGYKKVTILTDSMGTQGKSVHYFSSGVRDFSLASGITDKTWMAGIERAQEDYLYNAALQQYIINRRVKNTYTVNLSSAYLDDNTNPSLPPNQFSLYGLKLTQESPEFVKQQQVTLATFKVERYPVVSSWFYQSKTEQTLFNPVDTTKFVTTTTNNYFDNPAHQQLTRTVVDKSDGKLLTSISTYPNDYTAGTTFLDDMKTNHQIGVPIEQVSYVYDGTNTNVTLGKLTPYLPGGKGLIDKMYVFESVTPVPLTTFKFSDRALGQLPYGTASAVYGMDTHYQPRLIYNSYDSLGNPLTISLTSGISESYIWDYKKTYPIAQVKNADSLSIAYTSFEADGTGHWAIGSTVRDNTSAITGVNSYNLTNGAMSKTGLTAATTYVVSYWTRNASPFNISGTISGYPVRGATSNGWTYYEHRITGQTAISLSGIGNIDEVRLYPMGAQMTTYTYNPLVGMTSLTDAKGETTTYEYDNFQRLINVKDKDGNIVKHTDYHYQGQ